MANIEVDQEISAGIVDPMGGANQTRVRAYNERLVLSLVRRHGSLSKAEIARRTGLSAQTVSVIMRALEKDGLLTRGSPQRGRVGQPSIPMSLNPDGVLSLGLKIGRRSADLILLDFTGRVRFQLHEAYRYPTPAGVLAFVEASVAKVLADMSPAERGRIAGLGVALPFELWNWVEEVGAPMADMDAWRHADIAALLNSPLVMVRASPISLISFWAPSLAVAWCSIMRSIPAGPAMQALLAPCLLPPRKAGMTSSSTTPPSFCSKKCCLRPDAIRHRSG